MTLETHSENMHHARNALARERVLAHLKSLVRDSEDLLQATADGVSEKVKDARVLPAALAVADSASQDWGKHLMACVNHYGLPLRRWKNM